MNLLHQGRRCLCRGWRCCSLFHSTAGAHIIKFICIFPANIRVPDGVRQALPETSRCFLRVHCSPMIDIIHTRTCIDHPFSSLPLDTRTGAANRYCSRAGNNTRARNKEDEGVHRQAHANLRWTMGCRPELLAKDFSNSKLACRMPCFVATETA